MSTSDLFKLRQFTFLFLSIFLMPGNCYPVLLDRTVFTATASHAYANTATADKAIDGQIGTSWREVFASGTVQNPWLKIDLGASWQIHMVHFYYEKL